MKKKEVPLEDRACTRSWDFTGTLIHEVIHFFNQVTGAQRDEAKKIARFSYKQGFIDGATYQKNKKVREK